MASMVSQATPALEPYVDVEAASGFLHLAPKTLNAWARQGKIPAYPFGDGQRKTWRFKLSELDSWMQSRLHCERRPPLSERRTR